MQILIVKIDLHPLKTVDLIEMKIEQLQVCNERDNYFED